MNSNLEDLEKEVQKVINLATRQRIEEARQEKLIPNLADKDIIYWKRHKNHE